MGLLDPEMFSPVDSPRELDAARDPVAQENTAGDRAHLRWQRAARCLQTQLSRRVVLEVVMGSPLPDQRFASQVTGNFTTK